MEIKGVTDKVSPYVYTSMVYPCMVIMDNTSMPKHKWSLLKNLVGYSGEDDSVTIYVSTKGELYKIGVAAKMSVMPIIDLVGIENIKGYYAEDKELTGSRLYVLA